ncbi:MAG TPA: sensor histidine kinase [Chloroflexia bacterium]|nr:sensor histidine kinase [Chloroflexia bacterium]
MAQESADHKETNPQAARAMPPVVNRVLVFFYVLTWANLLYCTYVAARDTSNGDYGFLVPVGLYALLFATMFVIGLQRYRREGGSMSDVLWGYDDPAWLQVAFVGISLVLVFWMNTYSLAFFSVYFPLIAATFGTFKWQIAVPIIAVQMSALAYQLGIFGGGDNPELSTGALIGISFSVLSFIAIFVFMTILMRSRIESEQLVQELKATKQRLEEALAREEEVAVLRERNRMAREMHDVLGHALSLVAVKIEAAQRLQAVDPDRASAELDATKDLVRQSMSDLRASLADLRSPTFEVGAKPLSQALQEWSARTAKEGGFSIEYDFEPGVDALPAPIQDALWRVGREAVLNVMKHARAKRVEINAFQKDGKAYLSVGDDGVGIPHLAEGSARLEVEGHYGLRGMRERLEALGGQLAVKPGRDGHGTLVLANVPLPPTEKPPAERLRDRLSPTRGILFRRGAR